MTFLGKLARACLGIFGLDEDESPRLLADILLGTLGAFATLILLVYSFERHPVEEFKTAALVSAAVVVLVVVLSKHRLYVLLAIVAVVGLRGFLAFSLYGYWPGLILAGCGVGAIWLAVRVSQKG